MINNATLSTYGERSADDRQSEKTKSKYFQMNAYIKETSHGWEDAGLKIETDKVSASLVGLRKNLFRIFPRRPNVAFGLGKGVIKFLDAAGHILGASVRPSGRGLATQSFPLPLCGQERGRTNERGTSRRDGTSVDQGVVLPRMV